MLTCSGWTEGGTGILSWLFSVVCSWFLDTKPVSASRFLHTWCWIFEYFEKIIVWDDGRVGCLKLPINVSLLPTFVKFERYTYSLVWVRYNLVGLIVGGEYAYTCSFITIWFYSFMNELGWLELCHLLFCLYFIPNFPSQYNMHKTIKTPWK